MFHLNLDEIANHIAEGGFWTWLVWVSKRAWDINHAFRKIRELEKHTGYKQEEKTKAK